MSTKRAEYIGQFLKVQVLLIVDSHRHESHKGK